MQPHLQKEYGSHTQVSLHRINIKAERSGKIEITSQKTDTDPIGTDYCVCGCQV